MLPLSITPVADAVFIRAAQKSIQRGILVPDASQRRAFSPRPPESWLIQPDRTSQLASTEANRPNDRALASKLANNVNIYFERRSSSAQILSEEAPLNQTAQALGNVDRKPEPVGTSYSRSEPSALWEHDGLEQ